MADPFVHLAGTFAPREKTVKLIHGILDRALPGHIVKSPVLFPFLALKFSGGVIHQPENQILDLGLCEHRFILPF